MKMYQIYSKLVQTCVIHHAPPHNNIIERTAAVARVA